MVHGGRDDNDGYGIAVDANAEVIVTMTTKMLLMVILLLLLMLLSMMMMMMIKRRTITGLKGHLIYNFNITFNQFWLGWLEYTKYIGEWVGGGGGWYLFMQNQTSDLFHLLDLLPEIRLEQQGLQPLLIPIYLAHLVRKRNTSHSSSIC